MLLLVYLNIHNSSELEQFVLIFGPGSFHRDLFITEGIVGLQFERTLPTHGHFFTNSEKKTSFSSVWEIKEGKTTAVVYITSFHGRVLEYDGGGGGG